jgi:hypothetical protein
LAIGADKYRLSDREREALKDQATAVSAGMALGVGSDSGIADLVHGRGFLRQAAVQAMLTQAAPVNPADLPAGMQGSAGRMLYSAMLAETIGTGVDKREYTRLASDFGGALMEARGVADRGGAVDVEGLTASYRALLDVSGGAARRSGPGGMLSLLALSASARIPIPGLRSKAVEASIAGMTSSPLLRLAMTGQMKEYYEASDRWNKKVTGIKKQWREGKVLDSVRYRLPSTSNVRGALERYMAGMPSDMSKATPDILRKLSGDVISALGGAGTAELEEAARVLASDPMLGSEFGQYANQLLAVEQGWKKKRTPKEALLSLERMTGIDVYQGLQPWEKDLAKKGKPTWLTQAKIAEELSKNYMMEGGTRSEQIRNAYKFAGLFTQAMGAENLDQQKDYARKIVSATRELTKSPRGTNISGEQGGAGDLARLVQLLSDEHEERKGLKELFEAGGGATVKLDDATLNSLSERISTLIYNAENGGGKGGEGSEGKLKQVPVE